MGSGVVVDPAQARAGTNHIRSASESADQSATYVDFRVGLQTSSKWGQESGPDAFMKSYTDKLNTMQQQLMIMKDEYVQFAKTMDSIINTFHGTDETAAANLRAALAAAATAQPGTPSGVLAQKRLMDAMNPLIPHMAP